MTRSGPSLLEIPWKVVLVSLISVKAKLSLYPCLTKRHAMKRYGGVKVWLHRFLPMALYRGAWSASRPRPLNPPRNSLRYPLNGPQSRSGLCGQQKDSCPCWESNPRRPVRSLWLSEWAWWVSNPQTSVKLWHETRSPQRFDVSHLRLQY
jgi:hypothetical protein